MTIKVYRATWFDIEDIVAAARDFYRESNFDGRLTIRSDGYRAILQEYISSHNVASFVARDDNDDLLGYIHIYCQNDYTEEMVGELYQFYVIQRARGTGVGRALVSAAVEQYRKWGCRRAYAEASPGIDEDGKALKQFINLWSKFGYAETGVTMMLEI